jgi:hypothetical protein
MDVIPVLFTRKDSIYLSLPNTDCFDIDRNAKSYTGSSPIIAHPPCRSWGVLAHLAKPREGEKELAPWAVDLVRKNGGVLEHPRGSGLWREKPLPLPGQFDEFGGFTFPVFQLWFGHKAQKATFLYICGCLPLQLPAVPLHLGSASYVVAKSRSKHQKLPEISKSDRERTPVLFAEFLIDIVKVIQANKGILARPADIKSRGRF